MSLNSWEIRDALTDLGFRGRGADRTYAARFEREDFEKPLYVKKRKENKPVAKSPLVIHPMYVVDREKLLQIEGCTIDFDGYKNTNLDEFPQAEDGARGTKYGLAIDVKDETSLAKLIALLSGKSHSTERALSPANESDPKSNTFPVEDSKPSNLKLVDTSEREAIVKVRHGQGVFRDLLIQEHGMTCWMSGVKSRALLIASHIKPWSFCDNDIAARGNANNGLLLSALWDAAFDAGLISFDEHWRVIASPQLDEQAHQELGLKERRVLNEKFRNEERHKFLAFHRSEIFQAT